MGIIDFDNGVMAVQMYSNVIHARSLGRGQTGITQIDGTKGAIVDDEVHVVAAQDLQRGARSTPIRPERITRQEAGVEVLEALRLSGSGIAWENPLARYPLAEPQVAVADELLSIARAVQANTEPEYGAARGRLDQEMNIAMLESGQFDRQTMRFPLTKPTTYEEAVHARFRERYGCGAEEVDTLIDRFFPRV